MQIYKLSAVPDDVIWSLISNFQLEIRSIVNLSLCFFSNVSNMLWMSSNWGHAEIFIYLNSISSENEYINVLNAHISFLAHVFVLWHLLQGEVRERKQNQNKHFVFECKVVRDRIYRLRLNLSEVSKREDISVFFSVYTICIHYYITSLFLLYFEFYPCFDVYLRIITT